MASGLGFWEGAQTVRKTVRVRISLSFNMLSLYASSSQFVASPHIVLLYWFVLFQLSETLESLDVSKLRTLPLYQLGRRMGKKYELVNGAVFWEKATF